jgi:hypothetical protein
MAQNQQEISELIDSLESAELRGDVSYLDEHLSEDFIGVGPRGFLLTKQEWVGRHRSGDLKYTSLYTDEIVVHLVKDEVVVATGKEMSSARYQGNDMPPDQFRFMMVFVKEDGDWRLGGKQLSPIMVPPPLTKQGP